MLCTVKAFIRLLFELKADWFFILIFLFAMSCSLEVISQAPHESGLILKDVSYCIVFQKVEITDKQVCLYSKYCKLFNYTNIN